MKMTFSVILMLLTTFGSASAQDISKPSAAEIKKVLDYYYLAENKSPVLLEMKFCQEVHSEGDDKNNCKTEMTANNVSSNTTSNVWMNFLVPKNSPTTSIILQLAYKGVTRDTWTTNLSGALRFRTWHRFNFTKNGEWMVKLFSENGDDIVELHSQTITVVDAIAATSEGTETAINTVAAESTKR